MGSGESEKWMKKEDRDEGREKSGKRNTQKKNVTRELEKLRR